MYPDGFGLSVKACLQHANNAVFPSLNCRPRPAGLEKSAGDMEMRLDTKAVDECTALGLQGGAPQVRQELEAVPQRWVS